MHVAVSDLIKAAFEEAVHGPYRRRLLDDLCGWPDLDGVLPEVLPGIVWATESLGWRRDALWTAVMRAYRRSGGTPWGGVILELTRPVLVPALQRLDDFSGNETSGNEVPRAGLELHQGSGISDREDIAQDVVAEMLRLARTCVLPRPARWTPHRLATQTLRGIRRELRREAGRATEIVSLDVEGANGVSADAPDESHALIQMLVSRGCSRADAELIVGTVVLGQSLEQIALTSGVGYQALWQRRARALDRLRRGHLAA